jgi:hypothetical protein
MPRFDRDHYLDTPEGLSAQYRHRTLRRFRYCIDDVEPRAKKSMPDRESLA